MKLENKKLIFTSDKVIEYSFYLLVVTTPLVFSPSSYEIFEFPKMLLVYFAASVVLTFWAIKMLLTGKLNFTPTPLFWPIATFLTSQIISTIFSIDILTSIFGYYSRFNGGLLSVIAFIVLYFAACTNLKKGQALNLLFLSVLSGLITSVWGIASHFGADPTCKLITGIWTSKCWSVNFDPTLRIFATFGQPNWMAGYLTMAILVLTGFTVSIQKLKFQLFAIAVNSVLFLAFLLTNSRSAALALAVSTLFFISILIFLTLVKKIRSSVLPLATTFVIFLTLTYFFGQSLFGRVHEVNINSQESTLEQDQSASPPTALVGPTESGQIRLIVWKGAAEIFKRNPIIGSGVETFAYSYYSVKPIEHNLTSEWNFLYNKAHNEFLNYAATTGILGLGSFLVIILIYASYIIRNTLSTKNNTGEKLLKISLLTSIIAYLIHNFFGFSVVPTGLFFWIILATTLKAVTTTTDAASSQLSSLPNQKLVKFKPTKLLILVPIAFFVFSVHTIVRFYLADLNFTKGLGNFDTGSYEVAKTDFENAIQNSLFPQPLFLSYAAYNLAILSQVDANLVTESVNLAEKSQELSKSNLTTQRLITNTYLELTSSNPEFVNKTKEAAENLLKIAPTDAETHYQVGQILKILGEDGRAEIIIKRAIELKPDYQAAIDILSEWQKQK